MRKMKKTLSTLMTFALAAILAVGLMPCAGFASEAGQDDGSASKALTAGTEIPVGLNAQELQALTGDGSEVVQVSSGYHSGALLSDGSLWTWGCNEWGELGDGTRTNRSDPAKIMEGVVSFSFGMDHSAALKSDGSLWIWGSNLNGELGDGTQTVRTQPYMVMDDVAQVTLGYYNSAAIKTDGSLWMWGYNDCGQIGDGTQTDRLQPVKVMENVAKISLGHRHSAAIKTDGSLWMWGENRYGALGDGTQTNRSEPVKIMDGVSQVEVAENHSAAIKSDGGMWVWGESEYGKFNGDGQADSLKPIWLMDDVMQCSLGYCRTAALKSDGSLWVWEWYYGPSSSEYPQIDLDEPIRVMDGVERIYLSSHNRAAIKTDGSLWMWGNNDYGQIGGGTTPVGTTVTEPVCVFSSGEWSSDSTSITAATITLPNESYTYSGNPIEPEPAVTLSGKTLVKDTDYTLAYANNTNVGEATIIVRGIGSYTGEKSVSFQIVSRTVTIGQDTWRFQNFSTGHLGISYDLCRRMFGDAYGRVIYYDDLGNGGCCYGMAATAQAVFADDPPVTSFGGASSLYAVPKTRENSVFGVIAQEYIELGQISQFDPKMLYELNENMVYTSNAASLSGLIDAVRAYEAGGAPVSICVFCSAGGHALWGLRIIEDTSSYTTIGVYDSNWPGEERSVKLFKSGGKYVGWEFAFTNSWTWGTEQDGSYARISWNTPGDDLSGMINRNGSFDKDAYERDLFYQHIYSVSEAVSVITDDGSVYPLEPEAQNDPDLLLEARRIDLLTDGSTPDENEVWWSNLSDGVTFTDIDDDASISVASSTGGMTASVVANSEMAVRVSDEEVNKVDILQPRGSEFEICYFGDDVDDVTLSGVGDNLVTTVQVGEHVSITGATSLTVETETGTETVENLSATTTYTVMADDYDGQTKITLGDLASAEVTGVQTSYSYTGGEVKPVPIVKLDGKTLQEGTDYSVTYSNNATAGLGAITICGIGAYGGSRTVEFEIAKAASSIALAGKTVTYNGRAQAYTGKVTRSGSSGKVSFSYYSDAKCTRAVKASAVKGAGTYYVRAALAADANHEGATSAPAKLVIAKAANTLAVKVKSPALRAGSSLAASKVVAVSKAKGKVSYKKVSGNKKIAVASNGRLTAKKGLAKGTYKVKVKVTAKGGANYKAGSKTVTVKVKVK